MKAVGLSLGCLIFLTGASLSYADKPSRIVSMNLCTDELVVRLAEPERIAAITYFSADSSISNISEEAKRFHLIRSQVEEVMSLNPDLVFMGKFTDRASIALLKRMGYPLKLVDLPQDFRGIRENIRDVALALGETEKGERLIEQLNRALEEPSEPLSPEPRVLFYQRGGFTPGADTFEDAIIGTAGAVNVSRERGIRHYGVLPLEMLISAKPDYVIVSDFDQTRRAVGNILLEHPALSKTKQIQMITIPDKWLNCGGPLSQEAVQKLRRVFSENNGFDKSMSKNKVSVYKPA